MRKIEVKERLGWRERFNQMDFTFHSVDGKYWIENEAYILEVEEIEAIKKATEDMHQKCLWLVNHVIQNQEWHWFNLPDYVRDGIVKSWARKDFSLYGRFDLALKEGQIKFYEYNADTPTGIIEAGLGNRVWFEDRNEKGFQASNHLEEALKNRFQIWSSTLNGKVLHLIASICSLEDYENVKYLASLAELSGITTKVGFIEEVQTIENRLCDNDGIPIQALYKLYPWEMLTGDEGYEDMLHSDIQVIEPQWKMLLSNKGLWAALWHYFPDCPYLLPTFQTKNEIEKITQSFAQKPYLSREGANIVLFENGGVVQMVDGIYGIEGFVYQSLFKAPSFNNGNTHTLIGSWVVGEEAVGVSIREDVGWVTRDSAFFIPSMVRSIK